MTTTASASILAAYLVPENTAERRSAHLDFARLGPDLAELLGAELGEVETGSFGSARLVLSSGLVLHVRPSSGSHNRLVVYSSASRTLTKQLRYSEIATFPEMTATATKTLAQLAKDIQRRVIAEAAEPLQRVADKVKDQLNARHCLLSRVDALTSTVPGIRVDVPSDLSASSARFNIDGKSFTASGSMHANGSIHLERINGIHADKLAALVAALA